jgi:hypothetical protein
MDFIAPFAAAYLFLFIVLIAYWIASEIYHLRRYSMRALLILITILAIGLGTAVAFIRG